MSKYLVDDPWFEYLEVSSGTGNAHRVQDKQKKALHKRISKFRRSRRVKPFEQF